MYLVCTSKVHIIADVLQLSVKNGPKSEERKGDQERTRRSDLSIQLVGTTVAPEVALLLPLERHY